MKRVEKRGFTLLELMFVMALFGTCFLVVAQIFSGTVKAVVSQKERSTNEEDARMALDVISSDIREAYNCDSQQITIGTDGHSVAFIKRNPIRSDGISKIMYSVEGTRILRYEAWGATPTSFYVGSNIKLPENLTFTWASSDHSRVNVSLKEGSTTFRGTDRTTGLVTAFVTETNIRSTNPKVWWGSGPGSSSSGGSSSGGSSSGGSSSGGSSSGGSSSSSGGSSSGGYNPGAVDEPRTGPSSEAVSPGF